MTLEELRKRLSEVDRDLIGLIAARQKIVAHRFLRQGVVIQPTLSLGVAAYPQDSNDPAGLFAIADQALYRSKNNGRDQWTIANLNDRGAISSRSNHANRLSRLRPEVPLVGVGVSAAGD